MKKLLTLVLALGTTTFLTAGLSGCGQESQVKEKEVVSTPGGSTTTQTTKSITSSGSNPPANSDGQKVGTPK